MDLSDRIPIKNAKDRETYLQLLAQTIDLAKREAALLRQGGDFSSGWTLAQVKAVISELSQLQDHGQKGEFFFPYGKQQRLLESAYMLTDSLNDLHKTPLGIGIRQIQDMLDG